MAIFSDSNFDEDLKIFSSEKEAKKRRKKIKKLRKKLEQEEEYLNDLESEELDEWDAKPLDDDAECDSPMYSWYPSYEPPYAETPEPTEEVYTDRGAKKVTRLMETVLSREKLVVVQGDIYRYILPGGYYKYLRDVEFGNMLEENLTKSDRDQLTLKAIAEIKEKIRRQPNLQRKLEDFNANPAQINCINGVVEIDLFDPYVGPQIKLLEHSSEHLFTYCIKAAYIEPDRDGYRSIATAFEAFCASSFEGDVKAKRALLLEQLGYALSDSMKGKCMLLGIGAPNSGKSVIAKFVEQLFEPENLCAIAPHELGNDFAKARLLVPKINLLAEISSKKLKGIDVIKSITSGDTVTAAHKGQDSFEFRVKCKLWFFANNFPVPADIDPTDGFFNRLNILFFPHSIPKEKQDLKLLDKLVQERDIIFSLAVTALANLMDNGYQFTQPADSKAFLDAYKLQMNSVKTFLEDCAIISPTERVHTEKLLRAYHCYCQQNGFEEMNARDVHMQLQAISGVKPDRFQNEEGNRRGYRGIGLQDKVFAD